MLRVVVSGEEVEETLAEGTVAEVDSVVAVEWIAGEESGKRLVIKDYSFFMPEMNYILSMVFLS